MDTKRFIFFHDFLFTSDFFLRACYEVFELSLLGSKYKEHAAELRLKLAMTLIDRGNKFPERVPLISAALRCINNYCKLIDSHPTLKSIENILIPEIIEVIELAFHCYEVSKESNFDYNHYCGNSIHYRHSIYKNKLNQLNKAYNLSKEEDGKPEPTKI